MQVQVNTDNHVKGSEVTAQSITEILEQNFERYSERITRIEVHLGDTNSEKSGPNDKRCMLEARFGGLDPIAVTNFAESTVLALDGAIEKLTASIETTLGKLETRRSKGKEIPELSTTEEEE